MSRRALIRWISFGVAAVVCCSVALLACFTAGNRYETRIHADTARALGAAVDAVDALDRSLRKCACAVTPVMESVICTDICSNAKQVETAFSALPVHSDSLEQMAKHISVLGDFAAMLSRNNASGTLFDAAAYTQLAQFSETTASLHDVLTDLQRQLAEGETVSESFDRITDALHNVESETTQSTMTMATRMEEIAEQFPEVPALKYDGIYSDHSDETPKALEGLQECSPEEAAAAAAEWLGCDMNALQLLNEMDSVIPCYCFSYNDRNDSCMIAVTKAGAQILWFDHEKQSDEASCSIDDAKKSALTLLEQQGYPEVEITNVSVSGGAAIMELSPVLDRNVLCYPDAITVGVSLSDASLVMFDASDYIMHHTDRDLTFAEKDPESVSEAVPAFLEIKSIRPVICQSIGEEERVCFLCKCADEGENEYHIFVNALTGEQELILLPDEILQTDSF